MGSNLAGFRITRRFQLYACNDIKDFVAWLLECITYRV